MQAKAVQMAAALLVGSVGSVWASTGGASQEGTGMLVGLLIGFGVLVLLFQVGPAMVTFISMLRGLFSSKPAEATFSPFKGKFEK